MKLRRLSDQLMILRCKEETVPDPEGVGIWTGALFRKNVILRLTNHTYAFITINIELFKAIVHTKLVNNHSWKFFFFGKKVNSFPKHNPQKDANISELPFENSCISRMQLSGFSLPCRCGIQYC